MKGGNNGHAGRRVNRKRVSTWPSYLLKDIPPDERRWLSNQAQADDVSVSDIVRSILCARYKLHCPAESYGYEPDRDKGSPTILLRLQPKLDRALEREAESTGESKRAIILAALAEQYRD